VDQGRAGGGGATGKLEQFAADVGVSYATVRDYRSVAEKYDIQMSGRPDISFAVAKALMGLDDRLKLAAREEPWTVKEARELAAARKGPSPEPKAKPEAVASGTPEKDSGQGKELPVPVGTASTGASGELPDAPSAGLAAQDDTPGEHAQDDSPDEHAQANTPGVAPWTVQAAPLPPPCAHAPRIAALEKENQEKDDRIKELERACRDLEYELARERADREQRVRLAVKAALLDGGRQADPWGEFDPMDVPG
jgi:hypothetical protein